MCLIPTKSGHCLHREVYSYTVGLALIPLRLVSEATLVVTCVLLKPPMSHMLYEPPYTPCIILVMLTGVTVN